MIYVFAIESGLSVSLINTYLAHAVSSPKHDGLRREGKKGTEWAELRPLPQRMGCTRESTRDVVPPTGHAHGSGQVRWRGGSWCVWPAAIQRNPVLRTLRGEEHCPKILHLAKPLLVCRSGNSYLQVFPKRLHI